MPNDSSVLFVDDEENIRNLLTEYIGDVLGYPIHSCYNGQDALDYLANTHVMPKLVISDVSMPEMNGIVLTRRLYEDERYRNIPVALASSRAGEEMKLTPNVRHRIPKPYKLCDIRKIVEDYLGSSPIDKNPSVLP